MYMTETQWRAGGRVSRRDLRCVWQGRCEALLWNTPCVSDWSAARLLKTTHSRTQRLCGQTGERETSPYNLLLKALVLSHPKDTAAKSMCAPRTDPPHYLKLILGNGLHIWLDLWFKPQISDSVLHHRSLERSGSVETQHNYSFRLKALYMEKQSISFNYC